MHRVLKYLLVLIGLGAIAAVVAAIQFNRFLTEPVNVPVDGAVFEIPNGMAFAQVSEELAARQILSAPAWFRIYGRITGQAQSVQAGEYQIDAGTTPEQLLDMFVNGMVQLYSFTVVEGWNYRELLTALAQDENVAATLAYEDWSAVLDEMGATEGHPEGLFLPETYSFPKGTSDVDLLGQSYALMQTALEEEWQNRASGLPIATPYEALILASIIEKETALAAERPRISGVFVRRLQNGMRLQTDPTVIYGIGVDFNGNLTRRDLRTDTPYNTYTRGGLPPTPIALPGRAAIHAALHPEDGTELYFVATGLGDGSHKFSTTKDEHDAAVREYLARRRAAQN